MSEGRDKRRAVRRRVLKAGVIAFKNHQSTLNCTVRDISANGARLRVEGLMYAPDTFDLMVVVDGFEAECQVVRRSGNELAVRFLAVRQGRPLRAQAITPLERTPILRRKPKPEGG